MQSRILNTLVLLTTVVTLSGSALGQQRTSATYPTFPPVRTYCPVPPPVDPQPYPEEPVQSSYFLGVYTSKVRVDAYGGGSPLQNPGYGPLASRRVETRVAPGMGQDVYGMRINRVVPNSPASYAGLEPGDIILDANGYPMDSRNDLQYAINTSQGILEMKVLDSRTGRLVWVVAQTETQHVTPALAAQVRSRRHQANLKTQSVSGRQGQQVSQPRQPQTTFKFEATPSNISRILSQFHGQQRGPIRRGQR